MGCLSCFSLLKLGSAKKAAKPNFGRQQSNAEDLVERRVHPPSPCASYGISAEAISQLPSQPSDASYQSAHSDAEHRVGVVPVSRATDPPPQPAPTRAGRVPRQGLSPPVRRARPSDAAPPPHHHPPHHDDVPPGEWSCPQCTFNNPISTHTCQMCAGPAAPRPLPEIHESESEDVPCETRQSEPELSQLQPKAQPISPEVAAAEEEEKELEEDISKAKHQLFRCAIKTGDLEIDQEDLAAQLQEARKRLQNLEN